jgi:TRAP-type C4-dicarboxylate transport system permease small subunit
MGAKVVQLMDWVGYFLLVIFSIIMVVATFLQVIFRYFFNQPLFWSEEVSRYCFVWIVFVGAAIALKHGSHIGVDYFVKYLPSRFKTVLALLINCGIAVFLILVIFQSILVVQVNMAQHSPAMRIPMGLVYLAIPVGFTMMLGYLVVLSLKMAKSILSR